MIVETRVEGDPSTVTAAADWLRGFWLPALRDSATYANAARRAVGAEWTGQAAGAYGLVASNVVRAADDEVDRAEKATTLLDELAFRMRQREQQMADLRDFARSNGLTVADTRVYYVAQAAPGPSPDLEHSAQVAEDARMRALLQTLDETVDVINAQFREWSDSNVGAAADAQRAHADMTSLADFGQNLTTSAVGAISERAGLVLDLGELAVKTATGDIGLEDLVSTVASEGLEAAAGTNPLAIGASVVGSAVIETSLGSGDDERLPDPLGQTDAERAAERPAAEPRPLYVP